MILYIVGTFGLCALSFMAGVRVGLAAERRRSCQAVVSPEPCASDAVLGLQVRTAHVRPGVPVAQTPATETVDVGRGMVWVERPTSSRGRPMTPVRWTR